MNSNLLPPVQIEKLSHPNEEIRTRALDRICSKYELDLVDNANFENVFSLLLKLIDWFTFETHPHEDKVLQLIIKIMKHIDSELILKKISFKHLVTKIDEIEIHIDCQYSQLIKDIKDYLNKMEKISKQSSIQLCKMHPTSYNKFDKISIFEPFTQQNYYASNNHLLPFQINFKSNTDVYKKGIEDIDINNSQFPGLSDNHFNEKSCYERNETRTVYNKQYKIEYFPWQNLDVNDCSALISLHNDLRYYDDFYSLLNSCKFYVNIVLHDFPTEIILQRPLLVKKFLELLKSEEPAVFLQVVNCLLATVKHLTNRFKIFLEMSLIHSYVYNNTRLIYPEVNIVELNSGRVGRGEYHRCSELNNDHNVDETNKRVNEDLLGIKSEQHSLAEIIFLILTQIIPLVSEDMSVEECNLIFELIMDTFSCFAMNITRLTWSNQYIKGKIYKIMNMFYYPIKHYKTNNAIIYSIIMYILVKILILLQPPDADLHEILPYCIQMELLECISDYTFVLNQPNLYSKIKMLAEKFLGHRKMELLEVHEASLDLCNSMKSAIEFLNEKNKFETKIDVLNCALKALPCLEIHKNFQFIREFVKICLFKWTEKELDADEIALRKIILLKLLSNSDAGVAESIYNELHVYITRHLGSNEEESKLKCHSSGDKFQFLFDSEILMEIISHGINSEHIEIQKCSSEILVRIFKGKFFFSDSIWENFIKAISPCFCLLQCFAEKSTLFGRFIFNLFDPDIFKATSLLPADLVRGNLRFLFSKNSLIREESLLRLLWLLGRDDPKKIKLPRLELLRGINLSSICTSVEPAKFSKINQSFFNSDTVIGIMEILAADGIEPSVRRSTLTQLSIMLEDSHMHQKFLERNGLKIVLEIFDSCLIESEFHHYPDSAVTIMKIIKHICLDNPSVRNELSHNVNLYYSILRCLLLFNNEQQSRQQGAELLCLLLYNECIISVRNEKTYSYKVSVPQILASRIYLPFQTDVHWRRSLYAEPSKRESVMATETTSTLTRIYWNIQWFGGLSQVLSLKTHDLHQNVFSPFLPNDMKLKTEDIMKLRKYSITFGVRQTLFDIQNATSHRAVITALHNLKSYLILYNLAKSLDTDGNLCNLEETMDLLNMEWAKSFERFLLLMPSSNDDYVLLKQVIECLRSILCTLDSEKLYAWAENLITNEMMEIFSNLLKYCSENNNNLIISDVLFAFTGLIKDIITRCTEGLSSDWPIYINLIIGQLKQSNNRKNYDAAHVSHLLSTLLDIIGKSANYYDHKIEMYKEIITTALEILIDYHCGKNTETSFCGTNIIKNCLIILNIILNDTQKIKDWECIWSNTMTETVLQRQQSDFSWLLSLWYCRDPIVKALAVQLLSGFSLTRLSCDLILIKLHVKFESLWDQGLKILSDNYECNLIREKAAVLLSNLISHGSFTYANDFLKNLSEKNFYENLCLLLGSIIVDADENQIINSFMSGNNWSQFKDHSVEPSATFGTPSLITECCNLLINTIFSSPKEIVEITMKTGLLNNLREIFNDAPELCLKFRDTEHSLKLIKMYSICCKVLSKCMTVNVEVSIVLRKHQKYINSIFNLMNYGLFDGKSKFIVNERNQLWCEILDALSLVLSESVEKNVESNSLVAQLKDGCTVLDLAMAANGADNFISTLYVALSSNSNELKFRCLRFLTIFFGMESHKSSKIRIREILDKCLVYSAVEHAQNFSWLGLQTSEELDLNIGRRISFILLRTYRIADHKSELKPVVIDALGSLLSACKNTQDYCLKEGLAEDITDKLRSIFVKLTMANVNRQKKLTYSKTVKPTYKCIDTILSEMENLFHLLTNFLIGNEKVKSYVAKVGLASILNKLWFWCISKHSLLLAALKLLCTFTLNSDSACRSLAVDKSWSVIGMRRTYGSSTLIPSVMMYIEKELDFVGINRTHESLQLSFQLLENCCQTNECRCIIAKGSLIHCFSNYCLSVANKRRPKSDFVANIWYNFLEIFTSYHEGQLAVGQNQDIFEVLIEEASMSHPAQRKKLLKILRNISFNPLNRVLLLNHYNFMSVLIDVLKSDDNDEIIYALQAVWGLIFNSQKGKIIMRNAGCEDLLKKILKKITLSGDSEHLETVYTVTQILMNK